MIYDIILQKEKENNYGWIIVIEPDDLDNINLSGQENSKYKLAYLDENKQ